MFVGSRASHPPTPQVWGVKNGGLVERPYTSSTSAYTGTAAESTVLDQDGLPKASSAGRSHTDASTAAATQLSLRSNASMSQLQELQKQKLLRAMQRESQSAVAEHAAKRPNSMPAGSASAGALPGVPPGRTALDDYKSNQQGAADRARDKLMGMPPHLRPGINPIDYGCPVKYETQTSRVLNRPPKMAVDPKWSSDLKRMNDKIGERAKYERALSASVTGSISPELPYMPAKEFLSNPPTPFFEAGRRKTPKYFSTTR
eukprot:TRINITY_DN45708_c0_g1_i1.p1 TRINITY_DN45708_c0_g1~~TRINITY_DN45708_c0_g1_i1.p1  ORF type:complete len:259 (-),score=53.25 TRINITY_DN45708_c0_g1_i1:68-844(-)